MAKRDGSVLGGLSSWRFPQKKRVVEAILLGAQLGGVLEKRVKEGESRAGPREENDEWQRTEVSGELVVEVRRKGVSEDNNKGEGKLSTQSLFEEPMNDHREGRTTHGGSCTIVLII